MIQNVWKLAKGLKTVSHAAFFASPLSIIAGIVANIAVDIVADIVIKKSEQKMEKKQKYGSAPCQKHFAF